MTIDQILYCKVINFVYITYNCVTSGVSSHIVTAFQLLEARLGHISSQNFCHFFLVSRFLQSVGKSSDPSEFPLGSEVFKENSAFVRITEKKSLLREKIFLYLSLLLSGHTLVPVPLPRAELGRGQGHQPQAAHDGSHHAGPHLAQLKHRKCKKCKIMLDLRFFGILKF